MPMQKSIAWLLELSDLWCFKYTVYTSLHQYLSVCRYTLVYTNTTGWRGMLGRVLSGKQESFSTSVLRVPQQVGQFSHL